ncbi:hypothetical protein FA15DRAFT_667156 [Coprinopsis marcescibilis]|uniref:Uncharacterized protein n=1 Tax=Coprinopsis marcescibilis TaxID=230819 RepID=A0A5C3LE15_COPMA|nr:hypothetical protein FA15DRAFT_667156 [Coprinopsis marcescibilis]
MSNSTNSEPSRPSQRSGDLNAEEKEELSALVSKDIIALLDDGEDGNEGAEPSVAELLKRFNASEGIARDVESRLDDILSRLDGFMESLGVSDALPENEVTESDTKDGVKASEESPAVPTST